MTQFWDPRLYGNPDARVASGVKPPPLPLPIAFVTQSPGDLFLAQRGLAATTGTLVSRLESFTEVTTQRNEIVQLVDEGITAIDVGEGSIQGSRELLVLPEEEGTPEETVVEDTSTLDYSGYETNVPPVTSTPQATLESANPSNPTQYVAPEGSRTMQTISGETVEVSSFQMRIGGSYAAYFGGW